MAKRKSFCLKGTHRGNKSYVLIDMNKSWRQAQSYCREHYTDLVSVRNQEENQRINETAQAVWIGLFRDDWMWSDQRNSSFRYWRKKQPNHKTKDSCAVTKQNEDEGKWRDIKCDKLHPFICHWGKIMFSISTDDL